MAFEGYVAQLQNYTYLEIGYNLPTPVPSDLLLPFQEFVEKYSLGPVVPMLWLLSQGFGNLLEIPTLYVLKLNGLSLIQSIETGFLYTEDNSALYESITSYLGQDVLFESTVLDIERNNSTGIRMVISTPTGLTLVESQKAYHKCAAYRAELGGFISHPIGGSSPQPVHLHELFCCSPEQHRPSSKHLPLSL